MISELSKKLRLKAELAGIEIDDVYRNENGIGECKMSKAKMYKFIAKYRVALVGIAIWFAFFMIYIILQLNGMSSIFVEICGLLAPFVALAVYFFYVIRNPRYPAIDKLKKKYGFDEGERLLNFFWTFRKINESLDLQKEKKESYLQALAYIITDKSGEEYINTFNRFSEENYYNWFLIYDLENINYESIDENYLESTYNHLVEEAKQSRLLEQTRNAFARIERATVNFDSLREGDKTNLLRVLELLAGDEYYDEVEEQYLIEEDKFDNSLFSLVGVSYEMLSYISAEDWRILNSNYKKVLDQIKIRKEEEARRLKKEEKARAEQLKKEEEKRAAAKKERLQQLQKASKSSRILSHFNSVVVTECTGKALNKLSVILDDVSVDKQIYLHASNFGNNYAFNRIAICFREIVEKSALSKKLYIVIDEIYHFTKIAGFDAELVKMILSANSECKIQIFAFSKLDVRALRLGDANALFDYMTEDDFINTLKGSNSFKERKNILDKIDKMTDGHSFEEYAASLLKANGYTNVKVTPGSGDQGIDVLAEKAGVLYGIQCKCYSGDVGNKAVQEAFSGAKFYDCHVPVVMTNRFFTSAAKEAASKMNVLLWDRPALEKLIQDGKK